MFNVTLNFTEEVKTFPRTFSVAFFKINLGLHLHAGNMALLQVHTLDSLFVFVLNIVFGETNRMSEEIMLILDHFQVALIS